MVSGGSSRRRSEQRPPGVDFVATRGVPCWWVVHPDPAAGTCRITVRWWGKVLGFPASRVPPTPHNVRTQVSLEVQRVFSWNVRKKSMYSLSETRGARVSRSVAVNLVNATLRVEPLVLPMVLI